MPTINTSVELTILKNDRRGISLLEPYLPFNFCLNSAVSILNNSGVAFIVTGFCIVDVNSPETDGPPGAIAIGRALNYLGYRVYFITDKITLTLMQHLSGNKDTVIDFPIMDDHESLIFASELIAKYSPSIIISIERCGRTATGAYLNMSGIDISKYNAKIDYLFYNHPNTIGIGDGGNEIGMGNYAEIITTVNSLPPKPCVTCTAHTIISSVSNWGGYGLVAELSVLIKHNLLPLIDEEKQLIIQSVNFGAVDGISKKRDYSVDGFSLIENSKLLSELHQFVSNKLI